MQPAGKLPHEVGGDLDGKRSYSTGAKGEEEFDPIRTRKIYNEKVYPEVRHEVREMGQQPSHP